MILGVTGTSVGLTDFQLAAVESVLRELAPTTLIHGACVGADEGVVRIARAVFNIGIYIIARPGVYARGGDNPNASQAALDLSNEVIPPATHFARNRKIVGDCDILLVCPRAMEIGDQGGTAYTHNYAVRTNRPLVTVWPDGSLTKVGVV